MIETLDTDLFTMALPFVMPGGVQIGTRTSFVRLPDGGIVVHSPGPVTDVDHEAISRLGPVRHLVAPNLFHHLFLADWQARHPEASVYGPRGLEAKQPDLRFEVLTDQAQAAWRPW